MTTEPLWVDPTPVVRYVLAHCRVAQESESRDPAYAAEHHALCPRRIERDARVEECRCPCHHGASS